MTAHEMVVRPRTEHSISRRNIDPDALTVLYRLSRSGYIAYLVGGSVRDLLLGLKPKDFDIGTSAHPRQIKDLFRNCFLIGRRFRLAHIRFGDKVIETSTFRQEPDPVATPEETDENEDLYQRRNNTFGTPEQDAHRRDFTVNGLFYDIRSFAVIDHVGGLRDLDARLIRCIGDPDVRLREDPVRMLRAVRFAARLGFTIEPQTYAAICRHHAEIGKAAPPRLYEDLLRLFMHGCSEASFRLLGDCGMLADLFPEVTESAMQDGADAYATWRSLAALDRRLLEGWVAPPAFLLSTLMLGAFHWCVMHTRQSGHDPLHLVIARGLAGGLAARYRMPKRVACDIADLLSLQGRMADTRPAAMRRTASHPLFEQALALCEIAAEAGLTPAEVPAAWQNVPAGGTDGARAAAPVDARRRRRRPRGRRRPASPPLPA